MTFKCPYCGFVWGLRSIHYAKPCVCKRCLAAGVEPLPVTNKHVPLTVEDVTYQDGIKDRV